MTTTDIERKIKLSKKLLKMWQETPPDMRHIWNPDVTYCKTNNQGNIWIDQRKIKRDIQQIKPC